MSTNKTKPECGTLTNQEFSKFVDAVGEAFLNGLLHSTPLPLEDIDLKVLPVIPGTKHIRFREQNG